LGGKRGESGEKERGDETPTDREEIEDKDQVGSYDKS